jgi:hypothetical protein
MAAMGIDCPLPDLLLRGAIIGAATVSAIVRDSDSPWWMGPRGLVLTDQEHVPPIAANGALGFFQWHPAPDTAPAAPLPWMRKWGRPSPDAARPAQDAGPAPLPLFEPAPNKES